MFGLMTLAILILRLGIKRLLSSPVFIQPERYFSPHAQPKASFPDTFTSINCWAQNHYFFEDSQFYFKRGDQFADCACWINEAEACYLIVCQFEHKQKIFFVRLFQGAPNQITTNTHPGLIAPVLTEIDYTFIAMADINQLWLHHQQHVVSHQYQTLTSSQHAYISNTKTYRLLCRYIRKQHASYIALPWWKVNYFKLLAFSKGKQTPTWRRRKRHTVRRP